MTVVAGVDVGNATTEVAFLDGDRLLGVDRVPTRGRKGSEDSLRGAAALVRRLERRLGCQVTQARSSAIRAITVVWYLASIASSLYGLRAGSGVPPLA